ncbi:MAG: T9SS type A sorting domain-containing protein, partial [candidate division Zixibacteria bacterium]|nr:T9SS type A sorting domain-containing protein [candidate division Zixibacteria bacterium]
QNYPNPFNPTTTIRFHLERRESVKLTVYNVLGRQVATLIDETLSAGSHEAIWTGTDDNRNAVASGVYFYRLAAGELTDRKKMVLMR